MTADTLFFIEHLSIAFRRRQRNPFIAVNDISFAIRENETLAIVGESGSGKSVTALAIIGLLPNIVTQIPVSSRIMYHERNILSISENERRKMRGADFAMIFQEPMTSLNPVMTVGNQIIEVLRFKRHFSRTAARQRCIQLLDEVGLPDPERTTTHFPGQLSGGQQQRVMIAMALACEPRLLIADEPTTALDVTVQKQIIALLKKLKARHQMSILFISHDLALVGEIADRIVVMRHGSIREQGDTSQIFLNPQDHYTRALLQCRPTIDDFPNRLPVIEDFLGERSRVHSDIVKKTIENRNPPILLHADKIYKSFFRHDGLWRKYEIPAVKNISFTLRRGQTLGIVGESGSGKTTLGLTLLRLRRATQGNVTFDRQAIFSLSDQEFLPFRRRMQIVFQNPYASLNPRFTVGQSLIEPILLHRVAPDRKTAIEQALDWLSRVGLSHDVFYKFPHEFSGGQRQRIALARALTVRPDLLILDEPVSALDVSVQAQILNLLKDIQDDFGISYLFISHDLAVVHFLCDNVMVMRQGEATEIGNIREIFQNPKSDYTQQLLDSIPRGILSHA
ncbi:MAG: ABC transporter ATP-binding protein [Burkholderiales bacterium]|jgi:peptide/nickel transport system ATP-binding protein|nr:ABC transporter ATP-binding protein [Burkholderiales bacterium]